MERFNLNKDKQEQLSDYTRFESFSIKKSELLRLLAELKDKTSEQGQKIKKLLRRLTILGMAGIAMAQTQGVKGAESISHGDYEIVEGVTGENVNQHFSERVRLDNHEVVFVIRHDGKVVQQEGDANTVNFVFEEIKQAAGEVEVIKVGHTHPLVAYQAVGYDSELIEQMRTGDAAPMPPSFFDMVAIFRMCKYYGEGGLALEKRVVDPTGAWTYSADKDFPAILAYLKVAEKSGSYMDALMAGNPKVSKRYEELIQRGMGTEDAIEVMSQEIGFADVTEQLISGLQKITEEEPEYAKVIELLYKIESLSVKIAESNLDNTRQLPGQEEQLIDEYIAVAAKIGVTVTYTPNVI